MEGRRGKETNKTSAHQQQIRKTEKKSKKQNHIKDREVKRSMRNDRRKWTEDMITDAERERELPVMECEVMRGEAHQQQ